MVVRKELTQSARLEFDGPTTGGGWNLQGWILTDLGDIMSVWHNPPEEDILIDSSPPPPFLRRPNQRSRGANPDSTEAMGLTVAI
jgi:hypothetical protein